MVHPSLYVLEVVSLAVSLGATVLEIAATNDGETCFRFDGTGLSAQDCQQALGPIFESSTSDTLRSLGIALSAAHRLAPEPLTLRRLDGHFRFDGERLHPIEGDAESGLCEIVVPGRFGFLGASFGATRRCGRPCRFARVLP